MTSRKQEASSYPKTNSLPLKIDAWTTSYLLGPGLFRSVFASFHVGFHQKIRQWLLHQRDIHNGKDLETHKILRYIKQNSTYQYTRTMTMSIYAIPATMICSHLHLYTSKSTTTNNQQPTTNNQQPTTNNQQPTTNNILSQTSSVNPSDVINEVDSSNPTRNQQGPMSLPGTGEPNCFRFQHL